MPMIEVLRSAVCRLSVLPVAQPEIFYTVTWVPAELEADSADTGWKMTRGMQTGLSWPKRWWIQLRLICRISIMWAVCQIIINPFQDHSANYIAQLPTSNSLPLADGNSSTTRLRFSLKHAVIFSADLAILSAGNYWIPLLSCKTKGNSLRFVGLKLP